MSPLDTFFRALGIAAVMSACAAAPGFAGGLSMSLDEAVTIGLRENRGGRMQEEELVKAKAAIAEARSELFPGASVAGGWSDTRGLYDKDISGYTAQAGLSQLIYTGGRVMSAVRIGEQSYRAAEAVLDQERLELVYAIKKTFYAVLLADEFVSVNKQIYGNTREHYDSVSARFAAGQASGSELISMKASLASVKQVLDASHNQAESARAVLRSLLFLDQDVMIRPSGGLEFDAREIAYDAAFLRAMRSRPEIRQVQARVQAAGLAVELAQSGNRPTVKASWDYYARNRLLSGAEKNRNDYNIAGISVTWPVFDGWQTKARVERALVEVKQAQLLREKTGADISVDVKTAYLGLATALDRIKAAEDQVAEYKDKTSVARAQYGKGLVSLLELNDALLQYTIAVFSQTQSIYEYMIAKALFDKATGGPL